jgi:hypothetical protein
MQDLKLFWRATKERFDSLEKELIDCYIAFLREVARFYLQQGKRVFFKENHFVHWGEGNFGRLVIEGNEKADEVFGDYIPEIRFEPEINKETIDNYAEIKEKNIEEIQYGI